MGWSVYILKCADGSLYTGITTDVERRLNEHNNAKAGARYTRAKRPVSLLYTRGASDRSQATKLEIAIKKLNRQQKLALIQSAQSS